MPNRQPNKIAQKLPEQICAISGFSKKKTNKNIDELHFLANSKLRFSIATPKAKETRRRAVDATLKEAWNTIRRGLNIP
jgi:hypothetical protein